MVEVMARRHDSMYERSSRHSGGGGGASMSKAQVVYYLCRGGKMEPPHMIEVPHSNYEGLRLKDVKHRLTILRGAGMPNMFSWSCKRLYKNTHIWQDVCDEDSLTPASGGEYVLKGSEYFEGSGQDIKGTNDSQQQPLQRKFRGAESWLKSSPKAISSSNVYPDIANHMRTLTMDAGGTVRRPPVEEHKISNGGASSEDSSGMHDIGVCEVSRSGATSVPPHVAPAAEDIRTYSSSQEYKSGSSTPKQQVVYHTDGSTKPHHVKSSKTRRLLTGRKSSNQQQNVKMKSHQSGASCAFLHILSYCGGVETKQQQQQQQQNSAPPTELASSEYSFDGGICSAENKVVTPSALRSPQYSICNSVDHHQFGNRSGPLIPYSSEYFDVKETVTPPPASPLSSKTAVSRFQHSAPIVKQS